MFSFFKRFKGSKESDNAPEESQTAPEGSSLDAAVEAPAPVAPAAPRPAAAPVRVETPSVAAPSAIEPEPEPEAFALEETVEIVPPPLPDASATRSWLTPLKTGFSNNI